MSASSCDTLLLHCLCLQSKLACRRVPTWQWQPRTWQPPKQKLLRWLRHHRQRSTAWTRLQCAAGRSLDRVVVMHCCSSSVTDLTASPAATTTWSPRSRAPQKCSACSVSSPMPASFSYSAFLHHSPPMSLRSSEDGRARGCCGRLVRHCAWQVALPLLANRTHTLGTASARQRHRQPLFAVWCIHSSSHGANQQKVGDTHTQ